MKRPAAVENRTWVLALSLMSLLGICLVGILVASVGLLFLRMNGMQPVPLHSPLHANYSADPRAVRFPVLNLSVVEEAIRDQTTSTADPQQQLATVVVALETPVPTITLYFTLSAPTEPAATAVRPSATSSLPGVTPSVILTPTASQTITPTVTLSITFTPTKTLSPGLPTLTASPTRKPTSFPTNTPTRPAPATLTPVPTVTLPPTTTSTDIPTVTIAPPPTPTNTHLPPPPPTSTNTPRPYPPPPTSTPPTSYP